MKNHRLSLLLAITLVFLGFLLGFLAGRKSCPDPVLVSVPEGMLTVPTVVLETEPEICFPIDLNKASERELMELPGIGETMTRRILAYRRERGRFFAVEDLLKVEGMTENKLEKIRRYVYIGG